MSASASAEASSPVTAAAEAVHEGESVGPSSGQDNVLENEHITEVGSASGSAAAKGIVNARDGIKAGTSIYPLKVSYCKACTLPAEVHEYLPKAQFEKCKPWLRVHAPELFPEEFPEEYAAKLEALKISEESGVTPVVEEEDEDDGEVKVAVPIEQKTSGGKKKKAPAEVVMVLGQRKGKKQVTIVFGLDLFGIKLKDAAKAAKRKFATGSSVTVSADNRDVIEIQGARQEDFGQLAHKEFGIPKDAIFLVNAQKKKVRVFPQG